MALELSSPACGRDPSKGIVVSYRDEKLGDIITGGNVYDGRANVDARLNSNGINRILVLAALRPIARSRKSS
jgi:hypothetical protein